MPTFGENLQRLRKRAGFRTSKSLAHALGVVPSVVSKLENDQQGLPEGPTLLKLAKTLRCSVDDLLDGVDPAYHAMLVRTSQQEPQHDADPIDARRRPDSAVTRRANRLEERTTRPYASGGRNRYTLVLRGDSLEPVLRPGARLLVSSALPVGDGDLAYAELTSGERLVKIVTRLRDGWLLSSANPAHPPRFVPAHQIEVLHRVVSVSFVR